jgi:integrase
LEIGLEIAALASFLYIRWSNLMSKRIKTKYVGIYYRMATRIGGKGDEKVYYIVFKKDGKVHEEKVGRQFVDKMTPAKASHIRAERIEGRRLSRKELNAEKQQELDQWTLDRLWEDYKNGKPMSKSLKSDDYMYQKHIAPRLGSKAIADIEPADMDRLRIKLTKDKAPQTVYYTLRLVKRIVNYGVKRQCCSPLGFHIEMPKVNNLRTEDLTAEQLQRLLKAIEEDLHPQAGNMMKMALYTGMRRGEMFRLRWEDVDFDRGFIHIRSPKGGIDQKIPLNDAAQRLLNDHPKTDSPYVFPGRNGKQRTDIKKPVNRIKKKAGLTDNFRALHGLRHVFASMLASSGKVNMYHIQRLLTHKSPSMTQRYAHLRDETLRNASNLAGDIIDQALTLEIDPS